jgi:hypothetical protein
MSDERRFKVKIEFELRTPSFAFKALDPQSQAVLERSRFLYNPEEIGYEFEADSKATVEVTPL